MSIRRHAAMALLLVAAAWFGDGAWAADPLGRFFGCEALPGAESR